MALSHLHHDHSGGLKHFAGRVPVHTQQRELDYGMLEHPEPEKHAMARIDYDDPRIDWRLADGEAEIAPGVTAIPTYGHTPGHQSFVVDLDESVGGGGFVFAFDAADLTENIEHELAIGGFVDIDPQETVEPIRRLKKLAAETGLSAHPGPRPARLAGDDGGVPGPLRWMSKRVLLGVLTPSSNTRLEPLTADLLRGLPEVSAHFSRFRVVDVSLAPSALAQFDTSAILAAADLLADAQVDAIVWSGTSAGWLGLDSDRVLCAEITDRTGVAATTSTLAVLEALEALTASTRSAW